MKETILEVFLEESKEIISEFLDDEDVKKLKEIRKNFNDFAFYDSQIHGINHSEKVMLFAYILCKLENITGIDRELIIDAAVYHDIGRQNDYEDNFHGYCSGNRFSKFVSKEMYDNKENLNILKAAMEYHSSSVQEIDDLVFDYEIENIERFKTAAFILKDADALDRTRFHSSFQGYLDESYLHYESSKKIIKFAKEVNAFYSGFLAIKEDNRHLLDSIGPGIRLHGVGKDIFKMRSVLQNGILSKEEMKKRKICGASNFNGGNGADWISLIDVEKTSKDSTAYRDFIMDSISFTCHIEETFIALPLERKNEALELRLPYDNSKNKDEVYAYKHIPFENILTINIPKSLQRKPINSCDFIYMTMSHDILVERINNFAKELKINIFEFEKVISESSILTKTYARIEERKGIMSYQENSFAQEKEQIITQMKAVIKEANAIIARHMHEYYKRLLNRTDISIHDAIIHELNEHGIGQLITDEEDFTIIHTKQKTIKKA